MVKPALRKDLLTLNRVLNGERPPTESMAGLMLTEMSGCPPVSHQAEPTEAPIGMFSKLAGDIRTCGQADDYSDRRNRIRKD
jgi:hypothetical protein